MGISITDMKIRHSAEERSGQAGLSGMKCSGQNTPIQQSRAGQGRGWVMQQHSEAKQSAAQRSVSTAYRHRASRWSVHTSAPRTGHDHR